MFPMLTKVQKRLLASAAVGALILITASSSYFEVNQNERAGIRVMGALWSSTPVGPGPHFKPPFISNVDRLGVSQTALQLKPFDVVTVDNQRITLTINLQYRTPDDAVFHLLYEVGKVGSTDIEQQVVAVVQDRASRIFASQNTNYLSENREKIQQNVITTIHNALQEQFKLQMVNLQIEHVGYSKAFTDSNEKAVMAKNDAVAEENRKKVIQYQADQQVIAAQGRRDQAIAAAQGVSRSKQLEAEGEAKAILAKAEAESKAKELLGAGEALRLKSEIQAVGNAQQYVEYLQARATQNWKGDVPTSTTMLGAGNGQNVLLGMPFSGSSKK